MIIKWFVFAVACVMLLREIKVLGLKNQYQQSDYNVKLEIIEVVNVNNTYLLNCTAGLHWHNRTTRVINGHGTLIKEIGQKSWFQIQMYKFLSNEYRYFPLRLAFTCRNTATNLFGVKDLFVKYSNLPTDCNNKKGYYYMKDAIFDYSKLPPYIPYGRYQVEVKLFNDKDYVATLNVFGQVEEIMHWDK